MKPIFSFWVYKPVHLISLVFSVFAHITGHLIYLYCIIIFIDVSSLQVDRLLDAVRVAKSQAISQNAPGLQHLVIIDGTMLLNIK